MVLIVVVDDDYVDRKKIVYLCRYIALRYLYEEKNYCGQMLNRCNDDDDDW